MVFATSHFQQFNLKSQVGVFYTGMIVMENENLINFFAYYEQRNVSNQPKSDSSPSEELSIAIQHLIERLRDCRPINQI
jgi:hypothetical protein